MNIIQKCLVLAVLLAGPVLAIAAAPPAQAALFENAKKEACRGANLSGDTDCKSGEAGDKINSTLQSVLNILSIIVGIIAVILIIINGLRFVTSGGDSNNVSSARNGIIYAIVGLVVVALAQVIVRFVLSRI